MLACFCPYKFRFRFVIKSSFCHYKIYVHKGFIITKIIDSWSTLWVFKTIRLFKSQHILIFCYLFLEFPFEHIFYAYPSHSTVWPYHLSVFIQLKLTALRIEKMKNWNLLERNWKLYAGRSGSYLQQLFLSQQNLKLEFNLKMLVFQIK